MNSETSQLGDEYKHFFNDKGKIKNFLTVFCHKSWVSKGIACNETKL